MKTSCINPPGQTAAAIVRGFRSPRRAGSTGITLTDGITEVDDVTTLQAYGGTVAGDEGVAQLSYGSIVAYLTNTTGADLPAGSVVIVDTGTDSAVTTTTSARSTLKVGVALDTLPTGDVGPVIVSGYAPLVLVTASVTRGHYLETSTTAGSATASSARRSGSFGQLLTGGTTPSAILFESPDTSVVTDPTHVVASSPTVTNGGSATFSSLFCHHVQIGDLVVFSLGFTVTGNGSGTSTVGMTGTQLPTSTGTVATVGDRSTTGASRLVARLATGSGELQLISLALITSGNTVLTGAALASGANYVITGSYLAI